MRFSSIFIFLLFPLFSAAQFQINDIETSTQTDSSSLTHLREINYAHRVSIYAIVKYRGAAVHQIDARANFEYSSPLSEGSSLTGDQFLTLCYNQIKPFWRDSISSGRHYLSLAIDQSGNFVEAKILQNSSTATKLYSVFKNTVFHEATFNQVNMRYDEILLVIERSDELTSERSVIREMGFEGGREEAEISDEFNNQKRNKKRLFSCRKKNERN
jgi:hypothetical protein